jgi:hypothetical protein
MATTPTPTSTTTLPATPIVRWLGKTHYTVTSRTTPGRVHTIDTYHLTCTCPAGQWGKRCWALAVALQYEAWRRYQQAQAG